MFKKYFARISDSEEISSANLKINHNHPSMALDHNGSEDLHTPIHPLLINIHSRPRSDGNE